MTWMGPSYILFGIAYLIYSVLTRNRISFYSHSQGKKSNMVIIDMDKFLKLQFNMALVNSVYLMLLGLVWDSFKLSDVFFIVGFLPFHFINMLLLIISKTEGYVDYTTAKIYK